MSTSRKPMRHRQLAKIHIAKKELGLSDEAYRQMLNTVAGVSSSKDLSFKHADRVLEHLKQRGWTPRANKPKQHGATNNKNATAAALEYQRRNHNV